MLEIMDKKVIWILGLMHSGTTVVWRAFRRNKSFLCLDEPFSGLGVLPGQNSRYSYGEFIDIMKKDPSLFWKKYSPLHPLEELNNEFTGEQRIYFDYLLQNADKLVIDETHLHLHINCIRDLPCESHVVHLVRKARNFVSSHLKPNWDSNTTPVRKVARYLRDKHNKAVFWDRFDMPPGLMRDDVIGRHPMSKFGLMLADAGYDSEKIMASPALVRLLAYWHYHFHYLEKQGPQFFGNRFTTVWYEDFANDPVGTMVKLYEWLSMEHPKNTRYDDVHRPKPPFRPKDKRWIEAARIAGFSEQEIESLL